MIRIAICDDSATVCSELKSIILDFEVQINEEFSISVFYSGEELINHIKSNQNFDLIFLDIELGKITGVEVGHIIRHTLEDYITKIVYISSKDSYDRELFDVQPLHFLAKPLDRKKVLKDIMLTLKLLNKENEIFVARTKNEIYKIPLKRVLYFESKGKKIGVVSSDEYFEYYDNMENIINKMNNFRFISPHRSYMTNYDHILKIKSTEIIMSNQDVIPLSRNKAKEFKAQCATFERRP